MAHGGDLDPRRDRLSDPDRLHEAPFDGEENRSRTRTIFRHAGVEKTRRNANCSGPASSALSAVICFARQAAAG
jgi:hypothetical protein